MRISKDFVIQQVVDDYIVVPIGEAANRMHAVLKLNETSAFLWNRMIDQEQTTEQLIQALLSEYKVDIDTATSDVEKFISKIRKHGCII